MADKPYLFTKENAKEIGRRGGLAKKTCRSEERKAAIKIAHLVLTAEMSKDKKIDALFARIGFPPDLPKTVAAVAMARIMEKSIADGDSVALERIMRMAGLHYDQVREEEREEGGGDGDLLQITFVEKTD